MPHARIRLPRPASCVLAGLNREHHSHYPHETELEARIQNYELAARMQLKAAEASWICWSTSEGRFKPPACQSQAWQRT